MGAINPNPDAPPVDMAARRLAALGSQLAGAAPAPADLVAAVAAGQYSVEGKVMIITGGGSGIGKVSSDVRP
jgi:hypothetical protein